MMYFDVTYIELAFIIGDLAASRKGGRRFGLELQGASSGKDRSILSE